MEGKILLHVCELNRKTKYVIVGINAYHRVYIEYEMEIPLLARTNFYNVSHEMEAPPLERAGF